MYSDIWASGLMRRAAMAAGRRLRGRGRLHDAEDFVFADINEMCKVLEGSSTPTADDLAARLAYHQTYTAKDVPAHIGDDPIPPPDPSTLPPPMARSDGCGGGRDERDVRAPPRRSTRPR